MSEISAEIQEIVGAIPDGEWWKESARDIFAAHGQIMLDAGMTVHAVEEALASLYWAVASCYGD